MKLAILLTLSSLAPPALRSQEAVAPPSGDRPEEAPADSNLDRGAKPPRPTDRNRERDRFRGPRVDRGTDRERGSRRDDSPVSYQRILLTAALIVAGITAIYHALPARRLPDEKPALEILPKYRFTLTLPESVTAASKPVLELTRLLERQNFSQTEVDESKVVFSRGSVWRNSIDRALLRLTFPLPLTSPALVEVKAGWVAAFGAGELWEFCTSLEDRLVESAPESGSNRTVS